MLNAEKSLSQRGLRRLGQDGLIELLDHSPDPKVIVDTHGVVVFSSMEVEELLGYSKVDLIGKPVQMLIPERLKTDHAERMLEYFARPGTRPMGHGLNFWAVTKAGREVPVEISLAAVGEGVDRLVVANLRDASERRKVLSEMQELNRQLSTKSAELEAVVKDLKVFAQTASHDLQAPLRQISQFLDLLRRRSQGEISAEGMEFLDCAADSARHLAKVVRNVLAYSRIGAAELTAGPVDLRLTFDTALEGFRFQVEEAGAVVTCDSLPVVNADAGQISQLFQNLLANALLYRSDAPVTIHVGARRAGEMWEISVRDNGVGIDPAQHERIFEMLKRGGADPKHQGTGVGLAICKRVVERHKGRIWVESVLGVGTTFFFTLPPVPNQA